MLGFSNERSQFLPTWCLQSREGRWTNEYINKIISESGRRYEINSTEQCNKMTWKGEKEDLLSRAGFSEEVMFALRPE